MLIRLCAATLAEDDPDGWRERCGRLAERPGEEGAHWKQVAAAEPFGESVEFAPVEGGLAEQLDPRYNLPGCKPLLKQLREKFSGVAIMDGATVLPILFDEVSDEQRPEGLGVAGSEGAHEAGSGADGADGQPRGA